MLWRFQCIIGAALAMTVASLASAAELNPCEAGLKAGNAGNYQEAIADFNEAIRLNLQPDEARFRRAYCYVELKEYGRALADYEACAKARPKAVGPWVYRALILEKTGNFKGALAAYRHAVGLDPKNPELHNSVAWLLAVSPDASMRNGKEAEAEAQKSCTLAGPGSAAYMDTLAAAYAEQGRFDEAVAEQKAALEKARTMKSARRPRDLGSYRRHLDLYQHHQPCRAPAS